LGKEAANEWEQFYLAPGDKKSVAALQYSISPSTVMADGATLPWSLPTAMTFAPDGNLYGSNSGFGRLRWDLGR
jgi:hypothetical protein